jgi:translation initiation factor 2 subunit 1
VRPLRSIQPPSFSFSRALTKNNTHNSKPHTPHNREKGYIDLSKRRVSPEEAAACEDRYTRAKLVHAILRTVADAHGVGLESLYTAVGWPAYRAYGHAFDAFRAMVSDPDAVFARLASAGAGGGGAGEAVSALPQPVKDALIAAARRRLTPQPVKIRADVELTCFAFDGVLKIQEAMRAAEAAGTEACPVKMRLVAPPLYVLTTATLDKAAGIAALTAATEAAAASAAAAGGRLVVREAARAVSERDDRLLTDHLAALASANREVAGDDDVSDEDEGMGELPE